MKRPPLGSRDLGAGGPQGLHFPGMDGIRREGAGKGRGPSPGSRSAPIGSRGEVALIHLLRPDGGRSPRSAFCVFFLGLFSWCFSLRLDAARLAQVELSLAASEGVP